MKYVPLTNKRIVEIIIVSLFGTVTPLVVSRLSRATAGWVTRGQLLSGPTLGKGKKGFFFGRNLA